MQEYRAMAEIGIWMIKEKCERMVRKKESKIHLDK
jgi:hypothetical protein